MVCVFDWCGVVLGVVVIGWVDFCDDVVVEECVFFCYCVGVGWVLLIFVVEMCVFVVMLGVGCIFGCVLVFGCCW